MSRRQLPHAIEGDPTALGELSALPYATVFLSQLAKNRPLARYQG